MSIPRIRTRENHSFYLFIYLVLFCPSLYAGSILTRGLQYRRVFSTNGGDRSSSSSSSSNSSSNSSSSSNTATATAAVAAVVVVAVVVRLRDGMQTLDRVRRGGCAFSELSPPTRPSCQATDSFHSAHTWRATGSSLVSSFLRGAPTTPDRD